MKSDEVELSEESCLHFQFYTFMLFMWWETMWLKHIKYYFTRLRNLCLQMLSMIFSMCTYTKERRTFTLQGKKGIKKESLYLHKNFTYLLRLCGTRKLFFPSLLKKAAKLFFPFLVFGFSLKRYLHVIMPFKQVITFHTKSTKNSNQIKAQLWILYRS